MEDYVFPFERLRHVLGDQYDKPKEMEKKEEPKDEKMKDEKEEEPMIEELTEEQAK